MRARTSAPLFAATLLLAGCGGDAAPAAFARPPSPVTVTAAEAKDLPLYLDAIGRTLASESVVVSAQVTGRITAVAFQDGADLEARAPLFTIDPRPYEARLAQARARESSAGAAVTQAKAGRDTAVARVATAESRREEARAQIAAADAEAERALQDQRRVEEAGAGAVSQQERDRMRAVAAAAVAKRAEMGAAERSAAAGVVEAKAQLAEAEARIQAAAADAAEATAGIETASIDVGYADVRAPIAGRAGRRLLDVGNVVSAVGTPLLRIQRLDPAHVEFTVTENDLGTVQKNMARETLKVQVSLPDEPADVRPGDLAFLDNAVDEATGTVRLRATVANADGRFWPGRFVKVRLVLEPLRGAVVVPATAPQVGPTGTYVYVVTSGDVPSGGKGTVAEMRPVTLGQRHGDLIVVATGVAAGDRVMTTGQMGVAPGAPVRVMEPAPPGSPGAAGAASR